MPACRFTPSVSSLSKTVNVHGHLLAVPVNAACVTVDISGVVKSWPSLEDLRFLRGFWLYGDQRDLDQVTIGCMTPYYGTEYEELVCIINCDEAANDGQ